MTEPAAPTDPENLLGREKALIDDLRRDLQPEPEPESLPWDAGIPSQEDLDRAILRNHLAELRSGYATAKLKLAVARAQIKGVSENAPAAAKEVGQLRRLIGLVEAALEGEGLPDPIASDVIELAERMPDGPRPA